MGTKADIERGWTSLPADMAPVNGRALEALREIDGPDDNLARELLRHGKITRDRPKWVEQRLADWWLVAADVDVVVPLVWVKDELIATIVIWRDAEAQRSRDEQPPPRRAPRPLTNPLHLADVPTGKGSSIPLADREVVFSVTATNLFAVRVPGVDLHRLLLRALVRREPPKWADQPGWNERNEGTAAYIFLNANTVMPLRVLEDGDGLIATTTLAKDALARDQESGS